MRASCDSQTHNCGPPLSLERRRCALISRICPPFPPPPPRPPPSLRPPSAPRPPPSYSPPLSSLCSSSVFLFVFFSPSRFYWFPLAYFSGALSNLYGSSIRRSLSIGRSVILSDSKTFRSVFVSDLMFE